MINPLFLEMTESFLSQYSQDFIPHLCSHKCVAHAERYLSQLPRTINPFLKPIACQWTILETIRIKKANDVRLKNNRPLLIYRAPCQFPSLSLLHHYIQPVLPRRTKALERSASG